MGIKIVKDSLKQAGMVKLSKAINSKRVTEYTLKSLVNNFGLLSITGLDKDSIDDNQSTLIDAFEQSFINIQDQKVALKIFDDNTFNTLIWTNNIHNFVLSLEGIDSVSSNLKNNIDYDDYLVHMLNNDTLGIILVTGVDENYIYLFKKTPLLFKESILKQIKELVNSEDIETDKDKQDKFKKLNEQAKENFKQNKAYVETLDNAMTKRAIYDPEARQKVKLFNQLKMWYG